MAKIDIVHVSYKGAAPALADVIGTQMKQEITKWRKVVEMAGVLKE